MRLTLSIVGVAALLLAACQGPEADTSDPAATSPIEAPAAAAPATTTPVAAPEPEAKVEAPAVKEAPAALPPAAPFCTLTGVRDATVTCPLVLERAGDDVPETAGLQLTVTWDAARARFAGLESEVCAMDGTCATVTSPPATSVGKAGHALMTRPKDASTAAGELELMLYHPSNPTAVLAERPAALRFVLLGEARDAVAVKASGVVATSAKAQTLATRTAPGGRIVTSL